MIKGIGIDLIELDRIEAAMENARFIERILTIEERAVFYTLSGRRKVEFLAGRFAAKEAYSKALGTGIGQNLSLQDVQILNDEKGKPVLTSLISGEEKIHVSLSHSQTMATAFVIIEGLLG